ncbi:hypothetical protein ACHAPV_000847 [Trichoderma viride]
MMFITSHILSAIAAATLIAGVVGDTTLGGLNMQACCQEQYSNGSEQAIEEEKDAFITDPDTVNLQSSVFHNLPSTFTQHFSHKKSHLRHNQAKTRIGWTATGELGVLRQE